MERRSHLLLHSPFTPFQGNVVPQTFTSSAKATVPCTCSTTFTELQEERFKKDQYSTALCHIKMCMQMKTMSLAHDSCHFLAMVHITLIKKRTERMERVGREAGCPGGRQTSPGSRTPSAPATCPLPASPSHLLQVPPL